MKINLDGDALELLEDFVKYAKLDPEAMADVMFYDLTGFRWRCNSLEKAMKNAGVIL